MTLFDRFPNNHEWKLTNTNGMSSEYSRGRDTLCDTFAPRRGEMAIVDVFSVRDKLIDTRSILGIPTISRAGLGTLTHNLRNGRKRFILINPK